VPMHGTQRVRPSGASVGRRQASTSSAPPWYTRIHGRAGRGMPSADPYPDGSSR
jgi:hypothetical protein